ncbi:hypothetical protein F2Q68_00010866 [Brassica cretica]|uniref:Uncharacterized protein n=1 Tax=Brassica cretica TaxID=69181 RepID=A0A8S9KRP8_BRACR|nr:hypothetical protein F2Q68_00010866 [Brassica cretica]
MFLSKGNYEGDALISHRCLDSSFSVDFSRSVTVGVVGDHIFSDCRKMDLPELPLRIHTLGEEPPAAKSISYHTDDSKLFAALRQALHADEYEELKESKLGDTAAENIIKVMFNAKPRWKWTMDCWEVTGTKPNVKKSLWKAHSDWLRVIPSTVVCACEETSGKGMEVTTPIPKERIILVAAMEIAFWLVRRRDFRSISREEEEKEAGVCKG